MPSHCSPLMAFPSISPPLLPFSSSSTSSDTPKPTRFTPQGVKKSNSLPPGLAEDVADKLEEFLVAVPWFTSQGGGGWTLCTLLLHQLVLPLLGLRELGGDDHEAQVDHEEGTHLSGWKYIHGNFFLWFHQKLIYSKCYFQVHFSTLPWNSLSASWSLNKDLSARWNEANYV